MENGQLRYFMDIKLAACLQFNRAINKLEFHFSV